MISELLRESASTVAASAPHDWAVYLLSHVPGLPPIVQTFHIVAVAAIAGSSVFLHLRILGLAVPSQQLDEMVARLMPWTWWALPLLLLSGLMFILARPYRYFLNPIFGIKTAAIVVVVGLTVLIVNRCHRLSHTGAGPTIYLKLSSAVCIALWLLIMLAGRWIAYVDYLFPPP